MIGAEGSNGATDELEAIAAFGGLQKRDVVLGGYAGPVQVVPSTQMPGKLP